MDKLLDEALKYYKELQDDSPDNLALPKFHKAMQALIERNNANNETNVEVDAKPKIADFKMAISLLRDLADLQNGAPLATYEKKWQRTMDHIYAFLNEHENNLSE